MPRSDVEYRNAEEVHEGRQCFRPGCGGRLRTTPYVEEVWCPVCETEWRGR